MSGGIGIIESFLRIRVNARQTRFRRWQHAVHADLELIEVIFEKRRFVGRNVIANLDVGNWNRGKLACQTYGLDGTITVARHGNFRRPVRAEFADRELIPKGRPKRQWEASLTSPN